MLNNINVDRIDYTNISSDEKSRFYNYLHLLNDIHPYKLQYILNTDDTNKYSILEQYIYDIACTQFDTYLQKKFNKEEHHIAFSFVKNDINCCDTINMNCVENSSMTSIINLSNSTVQPFIFFKLTNNDYKNKNIEHIRECDICVSNPNNIITFDPNQYVYGNINIFCTDDFLSVNETINYSLVIQILNTPVKNIPIFDYDFHSAIISQVFDKPKYELVTNNDTKSNIFDFTITSKTKDNSMDILVNSETFSDECKQIFELKDNKAFNCIRQLLEEHKKTHSLFKVQKDEKKNIINNEKNIINNEKNNENDKFIQRFTHKAVFTPIMCDWIIHEAEQYAFKNGWETTRHDLYPTTDISLDKIQSVFTFMLLFLTTIDSLICKSYNVEIKNIDIKDIFIAKYDAENQNSLDMHIDGNESNFSISILLNDGFEGGKLIYADDIISYAEKGDMVIHTIRHTHGVTPVTKGVRYALVAFLNISLLDEFI